MKTAYKEAHRYFANAEELLREKAGRENGFYLDKKYVRLAGHAAWLGVLQAVDAYLALKNVRKAKGRKSKEWYEEQLSKLNKKLNTAFIIAYDGLHLSMGYDGYQNVKAARAALEDGLKVLRLCEKD